MSVVEQILQADRATLGLTRLGLTRLGYGIGDIAKSGNVSPGYVTRLLHLALLAPDITQSIAAGDHPVEVTATRLMQALPLPLDWAEQRKVLGMGLEFEDWKPPTL